MDALFGLSMFVSWIICVVIYFKNYKSVFELLIGIYGTIVGILFVAGAIFTFRDTFK